MANFQPLQRRVKNNTASTKTWMGVVVEPGEYYNINGIYEAMQWARDPAVDASLTSGELITNDGVSDITDPIAAKNILRIVRRAHIPVIVENTIIQLTSYQTVGRCIWIDNRNITYRSGTVMLDITVPNLAASVRIIDATRGTVLGTYASISSSGIYTFDFDNPIGDARLEVQVRLTGLLGILTPPSLNCLALEWDM